jgi:hypothetical protein
MGDPTFISDNSTAIMVVATMAHMGTVVRSLTLDKVRQKGRPRSRAKDQNTREVEASIPTVAQAPRIMIIVAITVAPVVEFVACLKIYICGNPSRPGLEVIASSRLPMQKTIAIIMAKPQVPLIIRLRRMEAGTTTDGFTVSSDIYNIVSNNLH